MEFVPPDTAADASNRGFFGQGDMQKEFEEASFALKPGEISPVIETASGLHLIERYVLSAASTAPLVVLWLMQSAQRGAVFVSAQHDMRAAVFLIVVLTSLFVF
jgi:parvulin-like peptidyl-prolyl isomerase